MAGFNADAGWRNLLESQRWGHEKRQEGLQGLLDTVTKGMDEKRKDEVYQEMGDVLLNGTPEQQTAFLAENASDPRMLNAFSVTASNQRKLKQQAVQQELAKDVSTLSGIQNPKERQQAANAIFQKYEGNPEAINQIMQARKFLDYDATDPTGQIKVARQKGAIAQRLAENKARLNARYRSRGRVGGINRGGGGSGRSRLGNSGSSARSKLKESKVLQFINALPEEEQNQIQSILQADKLDQEALNRLTAKYIGTPLYDALKDMQRWVFPKERTDKEKIAYNEEQALKQEGAKIMTEELKDIMILADQIERHPGFEKLVGTSNDPLNKRLLGADSISSALLGNYSASNVNRNALPYSGTEAAGAYALHETMIARNFLTAVKNLKKTGATLGQITEAEGKKLQDAMQALNIATNEKEYKDALNTIRRSARRLVKSLYKDLSEEDKKYYKDFESVYQQDRDELLNNAHVDYDNGSYPAPLDTPTNNKANIPNQVNQTNTGGTITFDDGVTLRTNPDINKKRGLENISTEELMERAKQLRGQL